MTPEVAPTGPSKPEKPAERPVADVQARVEAEREDHRGSSEAAMRRMPVSPSSPEAREVAGRIAEDRLRLTLASALTSKTKVDRQVHVGELRGRVGDTFGVRLKAEAGSVPGMEEPRLDKLKLQVSPDAVPVVLGLQAKPSGDVMLFFEGDMGNFRFIGEAVPGSSISSTEINTAIKYSRRLNEAVGISAELSLDDLGRMGVDLGQLETSLGVDFSLLGQRGVVKLETDRVSFFLSGQLPDFL